MNDDNIITKDEAIDRKKAGLPCETLFESSYSWCETMWRDFDFDTAPVFRKPPEPRRVAREFWLDLENGDIFDLSDVATHVHVREVLLGDVTLQRMTEAGAIKFAESIFFKSENRTAGVETIRALGLIGEGS